MNRDPEPVTLAVDMVRCNGHGICTWLFPQRVGLDDWGFARLDSTPIVSRRDKRAAARAVRACPQRALSLQPVPNPVPANTVKQ